MKIRTADLKNASLDWAVAKCEFDAPYVSGGIVYASRPEYLEWRPSTDWAQGGPIIKREIGNLWKWNRTDETEPVVWCAVAYMKTPDGVSAYQSEGPTPLIAAMRCFVASKLGDEVDVPDELELNISK